MKLPLVLVLSLVAGCNEARALLKQKQGADAPSATAAESASAAPKPTATRIEQLLDVSRSSVPTGTHLATDDRASFDAPSGWVAQGNMGELLSAMDTSTQKSIQAHCYLSARLQSGDVMKGIRLWAQSAGARPSSFEGPESIELGPNRIPADLYVGRDGITLGAPGVKQTGIALAIVPKDKKGMVLLGIVRSSAPTEMREKLAGCLQSFKLKS